MELFLFQIRTKITNNGPNTGLFAKLKKLIIFRNTFFIKSLYIYLTVL